MVRSYRVGASIGGVLLAALLLTGCSAGDDDAAASPSSAASPSASESEAGRASPESPSEREAEATAAEYVPASLEGPAQNVPKPVMPELAKEESREGAQAFLDYWSDAMWYAYQTGDTSYAREIISQNCSMCVEQLKFMEDVYANGSWFIGGRETPVIQESTIARSRDGIYKPIVLVASEGLKLVEGGSVTYEAFPRSGAGDPFPIYLDYSDGAWVYITAANLSGTG